MPELECCEEMQRAQKAGTDNEGYSALVYRDGEAWRMGNDRAVAPMRFCPWCGRRPPAEPGP